MTQHSYKNGLADIAPETVFILPSHPNHPKQVNRIEQVVYFFLEIKMPVVARFYGILIKMYFSQSEHGVPHFHAVYGEYNAVFNIATLEMMEGDLPNRARKLVKEWASNYQADLLHMWQTNEFKQLPGLE